MAAKENVSAIDVLKYDGVTETVGTPEITVLAVDASGNVLFARGATVPTDADAGYATGCIFIDTTGGIGVTVYINEGSATSADFNAVETPTVGITGVTAGSGLSGGGTGGTVTLNIGPFTSGATGTAFSSGTTYNLAIPAFAGSGGTVYIKATTNI